jgi:RimJ/RimL family protein N-acetyltransferase
MIPIYPLTTERLVLREWRDEDLPAFRQLNADPEVMQFFPAVLEGGESDALAGRVRAALVRQGWGLWAVEERDGAPFIGFVGLSQVSFDAPFTPAVEIGWRLSRLAWGQGYATEAGHAAVRFAFTALGLPSLVSFTATANLRSRRVMERLGFEHDVEGDFLHPRIASGHPLERHVLYRLSFETWSKKLVQPAIAG